MIGFYALTDLQKIVHLWVIFLITDCVNQIPFLRY